MIHEARKGKVDEGGSEGRKQEMPRNRRNHDIFVYDGQDKCRHRNEVIDNALFTLLAFTPDSKATESSAKRDTGEVLQEHGVQTIGVGYEMEGVGGGGNKEVDLFRVEVPARGCVVESGKGSRNDVVGGDEVAGVTRACVWCARRTELFERVGSDLDEVIRVELWGDGTFCGARQAPSRELLLGGD